MVQVLCPIDLSDVSRHALDYAVTLARWHDSRITILHVTDDAAGIAARPPDAPPPVRSPRMIMEEVQRFCEPWTSRVQNAEIVISSGRTVKEIVDLSETLPADLLILGTHGRTGFERLWLGSVAEKVLRTVRCPLLTVPPGAGAPATDNPFKTILCPIDFSDSSLRALEYAFSIGEETLARMLLMHVVEPLAEIGFKDESAAWAVPNYEEHAINAATARLNGLIPDEARAWCRPETLVVTGKPHREILRAAAEASAQLIVMGVHGRGAIDVTLFGSTTHTVIRAATSPVLSLRTP